MENVFSHTAETWAQGVVLSHVLIVVCQLLFCCPPLLMEISEHNSFSRFYRGFAYIICCFLCCTMSAKTLRSKSQSGAILIFYDCSETLLQY